MKRVGASSKYGKPWSREETIMAMYLFCQMPFGKIHDNNPDIVEMAHLLDRTPASLSMKMCNIARLDSSLSERGVTGLKNGGKTEVDVWNEYNGDLVKLLAAVEDVLKNLGRSDKQDQDIRVVDVKDSIFPIHKSFASDSQALFRSSVLSSYENMCCVTGLDDPRVLVATFIKPFGDEILDPGPISPTNGLCLNTLHATAFENGLFTIDEDYRIVVSPSVSDCYSNQARREYFSRYHGAKISLPKRFLPDKNCLKYHNDNVFVA